MLNAKRFILFIILFIIIIIVIIIVINYQLDTKKSNRELADFLEKYPHSKIFEIRDIQTNRRIGYDAIDPEMKNQIHWIQYDQHSFFMEKIQKNHEIKITQYKNQYQYEFHYPIDQSLENQWFFHLLPCQITEINQDYQSKFCIDSQNMIVYHQNDFYLLHFDQNQELKSIKGNQFKISLISEYQSLIDQEIKDEYDHDFSLLMRYQVKVKNHINLPKIWFFENLLLNQELLLFSKNYSLHHQISLSNQQEMQIKPPRDFIDPQQGLNYEYTSLKNIPYTKRMKQVQPSPFKPMLKTPQEKALLKAWMARLPTFKQLHNQNLSIQELSAIAQEVSLALHGFLIKENQPFKPSIEEILNRRKGDCNEFSTLLVAILDELGISATLVLGLVSSDLSKSEIDLSYHAWVAIWTGESILEVDPLWQEFGIQSLHLPLGYGVNAYDDIQKNLGKFKLSLKIK